MTRKIAILRRWLYILFLGLVGAASALVLEPIVRGTSFLVPALSPDLYRPWMIWLGAGLECLIALVAVDQLLGLRRGSARFWLRYPPLWVAVAAALAIRGATGHAPFSQASSELPSPGWFWFAAGLITLLAVVWPALGRQPASGPSTGSPPVTWQVVSAWSRREGPVSGTDPDLFDGIAVAQRLARLLSQPWGRENDQSIALLGPFGGGKSSALAWLRRELGGVAKPSIWLCEVSCWGLESSSAAPAHVLEQAVAEVERHVEALPLRGLSRDYQRLLTADPTGYGAKLADVIGFRPDPKEGLRRLSEILRASDARLVICIEDAERAGTDFDPQHVQRLLWTLRDVEGVSFILAVEPKTVGFDFSKVCDHVEVLPRVEADQVRRLLRLLYERCLAGSLIDAVPNRAEADALDLKEALGDLHAYARLRRPTSLVDAIATLLDTPRKLKHLVRRVDRVWTTLRGEIDLDDVIVLTALREGAPASFEFLVRELDALRDKDHNWPQPPTALQTAWKDHVAASAHGPAVQRLVDFLALEAIGPPTQRVRPQGIAHEEPSDYFRRFLAEEIRPGELRDQEVLSDMDVWTSGQAGPMVARLVEATEGSRQYVRVWEHFADRVPKERLFGLTDEVLGAVSVRDGKMASGKHPALLALWRTAHGRIGRTEEGAKWLTGAISAALGVSLGLASELYYFWASSRYGVVDEAGRVATRKSMAAVAGDLYSDPQTLAQVLDDDRPWNIRHLMTPLDQDEPASVLSEPGAWTGLAGPLLLQAGERGSAFAPHMAHVVGDFAGGYRVGRDYGFEPWSTYTLNRQRASDIFGERVEELLRYLAGVGSGEWYVQSARSQAITWLEEPVPSSPPKPDEV